MQFLGRFGVLVKESFPKAAKFKPNCRKNFPFKFPSKIPRRKTAKDKNFIREKGKNLSFSFQKGAGKKAKGTKSAPKA